MCNNVISLKLSGKLLSEYKTSLKWKMFLVQKHMVIYGWKCQNTSSWQIF